MAGPAKLVIQECGFNARDLSMFVDLDFGDEVAPLDVEDGMETRLMEALVLSDVAPVDHPHLRSVGKDGENYGLVDKDLGFVLQIRFLHPFVQSTKGTVCFRKPVVHFFCLFWHLKR